MPVPIVYRVGGDLAVQFTWVEAFSNLGFIKFYCCQETDNGGVGYFLTTQTPSADANHLAQNFDVDFDFEFVRPATIAAANAIVNVTTKVNNPNNTAVTVTLYHWDGATETQLGTATSAAHIPAVGAINYRDCLKIPLSQRHFKVGEMLRVTVINAGNNAGNTLVYMDPSSGITLTDEFSRTVNTDLTVEVPFKIQT